MSVPTLDEPGWLPLGVRQCRACGCTDADCSECIEATGSRCSWVESDLCSRCALLVDRDRRILMRIASMKVPAGRDQPSYLLGAARALLALRVNPADIELYDGPVYVGPEQDEPELVDEEWDEGEGR